MPFHHKLFFILVAILVGICILIASEPAAVLFGSFACAAIFLSMTAIGVILCIVILMETAQSRRYRGLNK